MYHSFVILACMVICSITAIAAEYDFLTIPYRGGVSIEEYLGQESNVEVPSTLGGKPVLKIDAWVFKGSRICSLSFPSTLLQLSEKALYGCRNLEYILFNGMLPQEEEPFSGLSGTLPEIRVWPGCAGQEPGTEYRGLRLAVLPGRNLPRVERQDHAPGNLFENSLSLIFSGQEDGFVLRYSTGFAEPQNSSASISGEATKTLTLSTRLALRWFTSDGQPASGIKRVAFGRIDDNPPYAPEDFTVRACYCQGSEGRLEIEDYHGENPVVRIPSTLDGKAVYNLCSSGLWNLNCLAVIMPPGLAHCGYHFDSCAELELLEFPQGLRRLTDGTARNCSQLQSVVLPDSLLEIGKEAFAGCILLNDLTLPNQLLKIEAEAFRDCHSLSSIIFPANLRQLGHGVFRNCQALTEVTFLGAPPARINDQPIFESSAITKINALLGMGWGEFFEGIPVNIIEAIIPVISGQTNDNSDFFDAQLTVEISIPETRALAPAIRYTLDGSTPTPQSNLFKAPFMIEQDCIVTAWVFLNDQPASPPVARTFVKLNTDQFQSRFFYDEEAGCWQYRGGEAILALPTTGKMFTGFVGDPERGGTLRSIFIPATVQNLNGTADISGSAAENPFLNQRILQTIVVDDENASYTTIDGVLFDQDVTTLIAWPPAKQETSYSVPERVRYIAAGAFAFAQHLENLFVPDTVENIGEGAFREMKNLQEVRLPDNLKILTPYLFQNCSALNDLSLPERLNGIGRHALEGCQNLTELDLPRFLKHIGSSAFRQCTALEELMIPTGIQTLAMSAFFECSDGLQITFMGDIKTIASLYGNPTATNSETGTNLLNPIVIKYWECLADYNSWPDRFKYALFGWDDDWPDLEELITFEEQGAYPYSPPELYFRFSENSSRSQNAPVEIHFYGYRCDANSTLYYTLDDSEPHPDNPDASTVNSQKTYWSYYYTFD
ncbi:MAG: leucine-rich repeat protein, partial [Lentisphaeria bacterium]